jgi:hypothetical protein
MTSRSRTIGGEESRELLGNALFRLCSDHGVIVPKWENRTLRDLDNFSNPSPDCVAACSIFQCLIFMSEAGKLCLSLPKMTIYGQVFDFE